MLTVRWIADGALMEETHGKSKVWSGLMTVADLCDTMEDVKIVELMVGIDDVSSGPLDPSLMRKARRRRCVASKKETCITMSCEVSPKQILRASSLECAGWM